jgi:hypothetical protein
MCPKSFTHQPTLSPRNISMDELKQIFVVGFEVLTVEAM